MVIDFPWFGSVELEKLQAKYLMDSDPEYKVELLSGGGYGAIVHTPSGRTVDVMVYDRERGHSYLISGKNPDDYGVVVAFDSWCFDSDCDNQ